MGLWLLYAFGAAVFAALTAILAKIGLKKVDSHLATAIRTVVVLIFAWLMALMAGGLTGMDCIRSIDGWTWTFLVLSGLATGGAWLCYFRALKLGNVNKVVPLKKSGTILTMVLAFIFLGEPIGWVTAAAMLLMGLGTWLMLELKKSTPKPTNRGGGWLFYAVLAAIFASLVAIFGRVGVQGVDAYLWTAIRTAVVVPMSWLMVFLSGKQQGIQGEICRKIKSIDRKSWLFLVLSGLATGGSWLFFYHALQIGYASHVVPVDRSSILLTMVLARIFFGERFSKRSLTGLGLLTVGTVILVLI